MQIQKLSVATAVFVALLHTATPSHAQSATENFLDYISDMFAAMGEFVTAPMTGNAGASRVMPPTPMHYVDGIQGEGSSPFWNQLEDAGYELVEVVTTVGIIPEVEFDFVLARELSDADRDALERKLEIDAKMNPGMVASVRRQIIHTLLEASSFKDMRIAQLKVEFVPLPGVSFTMEPVEAPMGEEHDAIFRIVQKVRHLIEVSKQY